MCVCLSIFIHNEAALVHQSPPLLSVSNLCWSAGNEFCLDNVNFEIKPGEFVGLIGPNGAGKSSLLRCLSRYYQPSSGDIQLNQQSINSYSASDYAQQVAVVLQHSPQSLQLAVADVVGLGRLPYQTAFASLTSNDKLLIEKALTNVGLHHKSENRFCDLSGGEKQRVMIARAMVQQPALLLMDEPTSHLDIKYQIQIMELAKSLSTTVVASFHDLNLASALCDQLILIKDGTVECAGTPTQVLTEDNLSRVFDVCAKVTTHPQQQVPHITYYYGYQGVANEHSS